MTKAGRGSYATYVVHPVVLVAVMLAFRLVPLGPEVKFVLVAVVTSSVCFYSRSTPSPGCPWSGACFRAPLRFKRARVGGNTRLELPHDPNSASIATTMSRPPSRGTRPFHPDPSTAILASYGFHRLSGADVVAESRDWLHACRSSPRQVAPRTRYSSAPTPPSRTEPMVRR